MKTLLFVYGSLILPENLKKFKGVVKESVFVKDLGLSVTLSPITKRNYHYIQLIEQKGNYLPGFLVEFENISEIDKYEGDSYVRKPIICYTRTMEKIKTFAYFKK